MSNPLSGLLEQVDESEYQDPDQIDEMPVQAGDLDVLRLVAAAVYRR
jgi:hypothetical protein